MQILSVSGSVLLIVIFSAVLSICFKRKIAGCIHTAIFGLIIVLYIFYCFDKLKLGMCLVTVMILILAVYTIVQQNKSSSNMVKTIADKFLTPGLLIFLIISIFSIIYTIDYKVILWDEERLWGAVPKALHETGKLQIGNDALIYSEMQAYPPAMMLFGYYITSLSDAFYENQLFAGYGIFAAALFVYAVERLDWKQWALLIPIGAVIVFAPCIITSNGGDSCYFYNTLFIDPILGIMAGFSFYQAGDRPFTSRFKTIDFLLGLLVLTLLKDSGCLFSVSIFLLSVILDRKDKKENACAAIPSKAGIYIIGSVSIMLTWLSWKLILRTGHVTGHIPFHLYTLNLDQIKNLCNYLLHYGIINVRGMFGYHFPDISISLTVTLAICLLIGILQAMLKKENLIRVIMIRAIMLLTFICFLYGYLCAFHDSVISHDRLPSFQRYMTTLAGCAVTFELMELLNWTACTVRLPDKTFVNIVCVLFSVAILWVMVPIMDSWSWTKYEDTELMENANRTAENLKFAISKNLETDYSKENPARVCNLMSGTVSENSMLHQRLYYDLLGSDVFIANYYSETRIAHINPQDVDSVSEQDTVECANSWCGEILDCRYDYIYVMQTDSWTERIFECITPDLSLVNGSLYRVKTESEKEISLVDISNECD